MTQETKPAKKKQLLPLTKDQLKFCEKYAHCQDIERAAAETGVSPDTGFKWYQNAKVRREIKFRQSLVTRERAKIAAMEDAKLERVTVDLLDQSLATLVAADHVATPALASAQVKAIELGYRRTRRLVDDNFVAEPSEQEQKATPSVYRALDTQILTHTIETRETRQIVTQRAAELPAPPSYPASRPDAPAASPTLPAPNPAYDYTES